MKGIFSFDGPLYRDKYGNYCSTTLTDEMFERYFKVVKKLFVIIRVFDIDKSYSDANLQVLNIEKIEVIEIPNLNIFTGFIFEKKAAKKKIRKTVKECDLIFARMPSIISNLVIDEARKIKKKYLVEVGGCAWDSYWNHSLKGKIMAPYVFLKEKECVKKASYASYVTNNWLQHRYPCEGMSISASNVYIKQENEDIIIKNRFNRIEKMYQENKIVLGTAAAIDVRYKGQEFIISILKELEKNGFKTKYELAGKGSQQYLRNIAKKNNVEEMVVFKGLLKHDEIFEWLDNIDIYVQPSKQEGLPRAILEAMSRGCIVIGSNIAGIPELLEEKFVFKNFKKEEILNVFLNNLRYSNFPKEAKRNYEFSKCYSKDIINSKREQLFLEYLSDASQKLEGIHEKNII